MDELVTLVSDRLRSWAGAFAREAGLSGEALSIVPPLHDDEATGLAKALRSHLVDVRPNGEFRLAGAKGGKGPYHLFSRGPAPALNREYVVQIAAFAELVAKYHFAARKVVFEYDAFDLAAFDDTSHPALVVEAKRNPALLEAMLTEIRAVGPEQIGRPTTATQRKAAALARLRPPVFWAVAPGVRLAFDVEIDGDGVPRLRPRDALPMGPRQELECPVCGSEEEVRGHPLPDGRIGLRCSTCDYRWARTPRHPCHRCGSMDVETSGYRGWAYEDTEAAAEDTKAPWHHVDWDVYTCQNCHYVWKLGHPAD